MYPLGSFYKPGEAQHVIERTMTDIEKLEELLESHEGKLIHKIASEHSIPSKETLSRFKKLEEKIEDNHIHIVENMMTKKDLEVHTKDEMGKYDDIKENIKEIKNIMVSKNTISLGLRISGMFIAVILGILFYIYQFQVLDRLDTMEENMDIIKNTLIKYDFDLSFSYADNESYKAKGESNT